MLLNFHLGVMTHEKEIAERKGGWTGSNNDQTRRCAVLLTSRWQDVLCNDMKTKKNFCVGVLTDQEQAICLENL